MTTNTHSHRAWTDKGGHVSEPGALAIRDVATITLG